MSVTNTVPVSTITETTENAHEQLVLRLNSPSNAPRVAFTTDTVDNEHMGKKKSKCCCIYKKPKTWQDSSSDSESDCETGHCRGHVEKRRQEPSDDGTDKHNHSH